MIKKYTLLPEHEAQFPMWRDKWIANAMATGPYTTEETERCIGALRGLYAAASLEQPKCEVFAPSPITGAIAAGIASGVWWLRENPGEHHSMFEAALNETDIVTGLFAACKLADDKHRENTGNPEQVDVVLPVVLQSVGLDVDHKPKKSKQKAAVVKAVRKFLIQCTQRWGQMHNGGNHWSGYAAYLSFFRHIAKLDIDYSKWQHYEEAAKFGPRYMHAKFWIVSARPDILKIDDENRPHSATGPSHRWPDGRELYYWRGTAIPKQWIMAAGTVPPETVLTWENVEQRRCLAEIIGWGKVIAGLDPTVVEEHPDPYMGTLLRLDPMPGVDEDPVGQFLKVRCGTGRTFVLRVSPSCRTVLEAQGELAGFDAKQMAKLEFRT